MPRLGDLVSHTELVLPTMLHCKSCALWYNRTCAKTDTVVYSKYDSTSMEFLCDKKGCNNGTMLLRLPDNVMSCNVLLTNGNIPHNDSVTVIR